MTEFSITVDIRNTGQVLACCGLFLLTDLLFPKDDPPDAWFSLPAPECGPSDSATFNIMARGHASAQDRLASVLRELAQCETKNVGPSRSPDAIVLGSPFKITIDWWRRRRALKTWAGGQNPLSVVRACQDAIRRNLGTILKDPLRFSTTLSSSGKKRRNIRSFGFDPRLMATTVSIGYSPDALGVPWEACPVTELAAFIALQYFQPADDDNADDTQGAPRPMRYHTWHVPAPWPVACAVYCGAAWLPGTRRWRFHVGIRDKIEEGHYKGLTYSQEVQ
jgi:hypothetical protein